MGPRRSPVDERRRELSARFLVGHGVEIGALDCPLWVGPGAKVTYVDRLTVEEARRQYPELDGRELVPVDVVDDGERLLTFADQSLDFVIANHVLEHCENPLGAMRSHLRTLRPGGHLYYAVPDKRDTFDADRPVTRFAHLVRDDEEGPQSSRRDHLLEWARLVDKVEGAEALEARARFLMDTSYSIHYHVWDFARFREMLRDAHAYLGGAFSIEWLEAFPVEVIAILRKQPPGTPFRAARSPGAWRRLRSLERRARALARRWLVARVRG